MTTIVVAAAVIERDGSFLVTKRQAGVHLEGLWEFPGGKRESGETIAACLLRELQEELHIDVHVGDEIFTIAHRYPERTVELHFFACTSSSEPRPQMGQEMRWVPREELATLNFPPADAQLIELLVRGSLANPGSA